MRTDKQFTVIDYLVDHFQIDFSGGLLCSYVQTFGDLIVTYYSVPSLYLTNVLCTHARPWEKENVKNN